MVGKVECSVWTIGFEHVEDFGQKSVGAAFGRRHNHCLHHFTYNRDGALKIRSLNLRGSPGTCDDDDALRTR